MIVLLTIAIAEIQLMLVASILHKLMRDVKIQPEQTTQLGLDAVEETVKVNALVILIVLSLL